MQPVMVVQRVPLSSQAPASNAALAAAVPAATAPAGISSINQPQPRIGQAQLLEILETAASQELRSGPNTFLYERVRAREVGSLNLPSDFFKNNPWLRLSREIIRSEVVS